MSIAGAQAIGTAWQPTSSLILGAWVFTSDEEKLGHEAHPASSRARCSGGVDGFLRGLQLDEWHHDK